MVEAGDLKRYQESPNVAGHLTVELGCGELSLPIIGPKNRFLGKNTYLGVDIPASLQQSIYVIPPNDGLEDSLWRLTRLDPEARNNIHFIHANMNRLPLPNNVADEVYLANVLNDPGLARGSFEFSSLFDEIRRILKPSGELTIYTSYHPIEAEEIEKLIECNNFTLQRRYDGQTRNGIAFINMYDRLTTRGSGFIHVATQSPIST